MPEQGEDILEHLNRKYGPSAMRRFGNADSLFMQAGRNVGIAFTNKRNVYPTVKAHALMEHIKSTSNDSANQIMEEMYKRYFEQGENINDVATLTQIAGQFGIDAQRVEMACADPALAEQVRKKDRDYKQQGISGVPFFIIQPNKEGARPVGFSGAQPAEIIAEQLELAAAEE